MPSIGFLALLMAGGAGFYGKFLIALCKELKHTSHGFFVRLEPHPFQSREALQDDQEELMRKIA